MSYCRSNGDDSDVYMIGTASNLECYGGGWALEESNPVHDKIMAYDYDFVDGKIVVLETQHETAEIFRCNSRCEMIAHLARHRVAGHKVPDYAFTRLVEEIADEGDIYLAERPEPEFDEEDLPDEQ